MNQYAQHMDFPHGGHFAGVQQHHQQHQHQQPPHSGSMAMYSSQPTLLQPPPGSYAPAPQNSYGYTYGGVSSPHTVGHPVSTGMSLPSSHNVQSQMISHPTTTASYNSGAQDPPKYPTSNADTKYTPTSSTSFDTTGQVPPPGMKPRVTATLWEDEGSLCFQVEARGICVARREDNHMINGTKLLNVAGMTRGRRDGILKSEKQRHVVKIGPMHLKGVWIPFERALEFANKEKITELLYPLFVHHISSLLYHPTNSSRTSQVMQAAQRRIDQNAMRGQQQQQSSIPPAMSQAMVPTSHASAGPARPNMERSHTFPTPPTSATGSISISNADNTYGQWTQQAMMPSQHGQSGQPLSIDTGLSNARSLPSTPATTPPGSSMQNQYSQQMPQFDSQRQSYTASHPQQHPAQGQYSQAPQQDNQYAPALPHPQQSQAQPQHDVTTYGGQPLPSQYLKSEMAPPTRSDSQIDDKSGLVPSHQSHTEEDVVGHHDTGYGHAQHGASTFSYAGINDHSHISPEMTGSPNHPAASGRATPRSTQQWVPQQQGYTTPPASVVQNKVYTNGADDYGHSLGMHGYNAQPLTNGAAAAAAAVSNKRRRDDDDDADAGLPLDEEGIKRRKTLEGTPTSMIGMVGGGLNRSRSAVVRRR